MYVGNLMELADVQSVYAKPLPPCTEALLSAIPHPDPDLRTKHLILPGEVAHPAAPLPGCSFHPRCPYAVAICEAEAPL